MKKGKILIIYPGSFKFTGLPIGIASLSGALRETGHQVEVFDTIFYDLKGQQEWDKLRADRLMSKRITDEDKHWQVKQSDIKEDLLKVIDRLQPKVIGISILEPLYELSLTLTSLIKQRYPDITIIAGGVFPTLSPDLVINEKSVDIVCLGEGEEPLMELCNRIYNGKDFHNIRGLWVKRQGKIYKNAPGPLQNVNNLPYLDFSVFKKALFYKAMQGRLRKMIYVETERGCPYSCAYCSAPELKIFANQNRTGHYYRSFDMERVMEQMHYQINKYLPEFVYFSTETFLAMSKRNFDIFVKEYRKIKLPFWFQTRFETITEERIKILKEIGMFWLTLGVEHGDEEFRKNILKRPCSNKAILKGAAILSKYNIGASLNNMMGLPMENRQLIFRTIKLNKELFKMNDKFESNIFMFVPYRGTQLYELCGRQGLLCGESYSGGNNLSDESVLNFPKGYKEELRGLMKTFNLYVKLPEKYWPQIKIAEKFDEEGRAIFDHLSQLL